MSEGIIFALIISVGLLLHSFAGFGGALFAVPLFSIFLPSGAKMFIPAYAVLMLIINIFLLYEAKQHLQVKKMVLLMIAGVIGSPIGAMALKSFHPELMKIIISVATLIFGILLSLKIEIPLNEKKPTQIGLGLLSGVLGGAIGESGPPIVIYGLCRAWEKDEFRCNLIAYFLVLGVMNIISYLAFGLLTPKNFSYAVFAIIPALFATWVGVKLKNVASEEFFRKAVLTVIIFVTLVGLGQVLFFNKKHNKVDAVSTTTAVTK